MVSYKRLFVVDDGIVSRYILQSDEPNAMDAVTHS